MNTMTSDVVDQQFTVVAPADLAVTSVSGRVTVRAGEESVIRVHATKSGPEGARANTRVEFSQAGSRVDVHTRADTHGRGGLLNLGRNMSSVDYEITVPRGCTVQVKTVSADVNVEGTNGPVRLQTVSGDVSLAGVLDSSVTTVSGSVSAQKVTGRLTLHTTSGDARIMDSNLRDFNLHSVSGDFTVETPLLRGQHYYAKTVSGYLRLVVPEGTGVMVQMKSISGDVVADFPDAEIIKAGRRHWQGRINGGGANVEMHSVSGDLRITRGSRAASIEPAPPPPPPAPAEPASTGDTPAPETGQDATAVLQALERGEIDVEQALARLRSLGR